MDQLFLYGIELYWIEEYVALLINLIKSKWHRFHGLYSLVRLYFHKNESVSRFLRLISFKMREILKLNFYFVQ